MSYSIGELSRRTGVNIETIRYYDRLGLFGEITRTASGHRCFDPSDLQTLLFIRHCREMRFSVESIKRLLELRYSQSPCASAKAIAEKHRDELRGELRALSALDERLTKAIAACPGNSSTACSVLALLEAPDRHL